MRPEPTPTAAIETIRILDLPAYAVSNSSSAGPSSTSLFRNQDDHVKNIAFLMNRKGSGPLSPAFDVSYAYNPTDRIGPTSTRSVPQRKA